MVNGCNRQAGASMRRVAAALGIAVAIPALVAGQFGPTGGKPSRLPAPRIPVKADATLNEADKQLVATYTNDNGANNYFKTFLNNPEFVKGVMPLLNYIENDSSLDS